MVFSLSRLRWWPQNEYDPKNEDDLKNENYCQNENYRQNEDDLKNEVELKNEGLHDHSCAMRSQGKKSDIQKETFDHFFV